VDRAVLLKQTESRAALIGPRRRDDRGLRAIAPRSA